MVAHSDSNVIVDARPSGAETARRALQLIELLAERTDPVPLAAAASQTGLPRATAYRLLRVLQQEGWAARDGRTGYRIGQRLRNLAERVNPLPGIDLLARPYLERLTATTGETATLHLRAGVHAQLVAGAESPHALRLAAYIGERTPLTRGAAGIAILAHLPETEQALILGEAPSPELTDRLADCRRDGYVLSSGENHPGVNGIAAPVSTGTGGQALGSITVAGPASRWDAAAANSAAPELLRVCAELSSRAPAG